MLTRYTRRVMGFAVAGVLAASVPGALVGAGSSLAGDTSLATPEGSLAGAVELAIAAPAGPVDESKVPHYFGPYPNWANSPLTVPNAAVSITPAAVTPVTPGNPLVDRANATDYATAPGVLAPVLVVLPGAVLPVGTLNSFEVWNQTVFGGSPNASAGNVFHAYVLRPTGILNEFTVVSDSGELTMPPSANPAGEVASFPADVAVLAGDVIGFYGQGIPVDVGGGSDILSYPATANADGVTPQAPAQDATLTLGTDPGFPIFSQDRTYSFAAVVTPPGTHAGAEATATATVGANGEVTGLTITNPGSGYAVAPDVTITGSADEATADAVVQLSGSVTGITVDAAGGGYTQPSVTISGGGATTDATAHALGGVDAVAVTAGTGYKFPTVDFDLPDDPNGTQAHGAAVCADPFPDCNLTDPALTLDVVGVTVTDPGSGYTSVPGVVIRDGTLFDPINHEAGTFTQATGTATLKIVAVALDTFGAGYTSAPTVAFADTGAGAGASATATTNFGAVIGLSITAGGSGYLTPGIRKFVDTLPGLTEAGANNLGQYIPVAQPDTTTFPDTDYYVIGVVQHREQMHSDLPPTLLREYVQLSTAVVPGKQIPLDTALLDGTTTPVLMPDGSPALGVDTPHYLGPTIVANKDRATRVVFYNLLPAGTTGDLFLPTDSTLMGSGMGPANTAEPLNDSTVMDDVRNPPCTDYPKPVDCFKDDRAEVHLHGGNTPWISDGTPHQWITPANEDTPWPQGVSVKDVPDMIGTDRPAGVPDCGAADDGCQTFFYTNQQSARLMFYHDHSWGITRLNVYAGEAAGYVLRDAVEEQLMGNGIIPGAAEELPLIVQDRTFVPDDAQLAAQDPTWDKARWGGKGNLWYHHVYMPAQNPGDPGGMSGFGRWMYGPWFWPPADATYPPIPNPYYGKDPEGPDNVRGTDDDFATDLAQACSLDDPATWQYQTDPFCEPQLIPGTPNISAGMEQFNDTPIVNGTAYPTVTLEPKAYRLRMLNAANDRFFNFQWYVGDPDTASVGLNANGEAIGATEVALNADELARAQIDPVTSPTPVQGAATEGPDWIQIGTEGGFLPAPVVVDGQQPTTWITDPTRFDVGNVDQHSLLLAPAERADAIVDFSNFAGQTLILYNDAPAAFPARVPSYDYYTGAPDLSPVGAPTILPGYGPNTRTVMQVKIAAAPAAPAYNVSNLNAAFRHHADGSGVFESSVDPVIVGQAPYNSAYGTDFVTSGWCNSPTNPSARCDGYARISDQGGTNLSFNTLAKPNEKLAIPIEPKGMHDEMNSTNFDEFGRMVAIIGLEVFPATPGLQNFVPYPFVNPPTELIDTTNLPRGDVDVTPITTADGAQVWKITHNGVDTHPVHFHLFNVQVLNRVTWDNIIIPPDKTELGWKDTVRVSPLEDTIVALRPIIPVVPFEVPNSIRRLNPMAPPGSSLGFNSIDPAGNPTAPITNQYVNFGWEYVWHCHILSHEEMDMMRPIAVALAPRKADTITQAITGSGNNRRFTISWQDNSINETGFVLQRSVNGSTWTNVGTVSSPLDPAVANIHQPRALRDGGSNVTAAYLYRVVAQNTVGYGGAYPSLTAQSISDPVAVGTLPTAAPAAPTTLAVSLQAGPQARLTWRDNATNESGFVIERAVAGSGVFTPVGVAAARNGTGITSFTDTTIQPGVAYDYRVAAVNLFGGVPTLSAWSNVASTAGAAAAPAAPTSFAAAVGANQGNRRSVVLTWADNATNETGFTVERATNAAFTTGFNSTSVAADAVTLNVTGLNRATTYYFRIRANNGITSSAWVNAAPFPIVTNP